MSASRKSGGSYRDRCSEDIMQIVPADFVNPWNFFNFFSQSDNVVYKWCQRNGLAQELWLPTLYRAPGGMVLDAPSIELTPGRLEHIPSLTEATSVIILFIKSYLERNSLTQSARFSGMSNTTTAVNWAYSLMKYSRSISITTSGTENSREQLKLTSPCLAVK